MDREYARTVALVTLWQVAASSCYYIVFAATPFFRELFTLDNFQVGLIVTTLTLGYAAFLFPIGAITDAYGEKHVLVLGLVGLSAGTLAIPFAGSYPLLLLAVFFLGTMYGTAMPGTNKAIYNRIADGRVNFAIGVKQVGVTAGSGLSAVVVTSIAGTQFGWNGGFFLATGFGVLVAGLFLAGYSRAGGSGTLSMPNYRGLVAYRPYRLLVAAGLFIGAFVFTTIGYTILYVHDGVGTSIAFAGIVLGAVQVSGSVGRIASGWMGDVLGGSPRRRIAGLLLAQTVGSVVMLVGVTLIHSRITALVAFVLLGFFGLGLTGTYYSTMGTLVSTEEMGSATAGGQMALTSGGLVGPPAFGYLVDVGGYRAAWLFLAVLGCIAVVLVALIFVAASSSRRRLDESG